MRIVYEAPLFAGSGGGPRHFEGIVCGLAENGVVPLLVLPSNTDVVVAGAHVVSLFAPGGRALKHASYEVSRMLLFLWWMVTGKRVDVWMARQSLLGVGLRMAKRIAKVVVLEVNGPVREEVTVNFGSSRLGAIADWSFRRQLQAANLIVAVSPGLREYVLAREESANCVVLPNGAQRVPEDVRRASEGISDTADLVYSGALTPWYDLATVFSAIRRLREAGLDLTVRIVGDGAGREAAERKAQCAGVSDRVEFTGWISGEAARRAVCSSRVGLLPLMPKAPHLSAVGSPLKLYEYAACSIPVVAPRLDGISNSPLAGVVHTYDPGDVDGCAQAVRAALDAGQQPVPSELWSWSSRASSLLDLMHRSR